MSRRSLPFLAAVSLVAASLSGAEPDREPPLELVIEIDGQAVEAAVGGTAEVVIDGKPRSVEVTSKPTRRFASAGVEFRYPSYFTYEFDDSTEGVRLYTVGGPAATVMVQSFDAGGSSDELAGSVLEGMRGAYGEALGEETDARIQLGGKTVRGRRVAANFAGASLHQDVFAVPGTSVVIVVQTVLGDDGAVPDEAKRTRKLFEESFRVVGPEAAGGAQ